MSKHYRRFLAVLLIILLVSGADQLYVAIERHHYQAALDMRIQSEAENLLQLTLQGKGMGAVQLAGRLNREIQEVARNDVRLLAQARDALTVLARDTQADHAFVTNAKGVIVQDWDESGRHVLGQDVSFRSYFRQAIGGRENTHAAVSLSTGERMLYVAAPVFNERTHVSQIIGVVVARFEMDRLDQFLASHADIAGVLVSPDGVIMASSRPEWLLRVIGPMSAARHQQLQASRQYGDAFLHEPQSLTQGLDTGKVHIGDAAYFASGMDIDWNDPQGRWKLVLLTEQSLVVSGFKRGLLAGGVLLLCLLALGLWRNRQLRRQSDRERAELFAFQQALIDSLPHPLFYTDRNARLTGVNLAFCDMFNVGFGTLLGKRLDELDFLPEQVRTDMQQELFKAIGNDHRQEREIGLPLLEGRVHQLLYFCSAVHLADSEQAGCVGSLVDISPIRAAERAMSESRDRSERDRLRLQDSEQRMQSMIRNVPGVVYRCLPNPPWTMLFVSDEIEKLTGYPANHFIGAEATRSLAELMHADDVEAAREKIAEAIGARRQYVHEYRIRDRSGLTRWIDSRGLASFDANGNAEFIDGVLFDVSERKRAEAAVLEAKRIAEDATRTKSEFLANMSHEIRTPMNAILGMAHLALQGECEPRQRNYIEKINKAANNLLGIINDILDFSKIEAGKLTLEQVEFRLDEVLENLASLIAFKAQEKGLELFFDIPAQLPVKLMGDPLRLGQVLLNLVGNAVKFTETGEIVVRVATEPDESGQVCLHFSVKDSGIGMTEEQCGRLFQAFSQADSSITRKFGGTGLGLTISRSLVEKMGGRIWVESVLGQGSCFHFQVHLALPAKSEEPRMFRADELAAVRVLILENSTKARDILQAQLRSLQLQVTASSSAAAALVDLQRAAERSEDYDLLLAGWRPGDHTAQACLSGLAELKLSHMPEVIVVTSFGREGFASLALESGLSYSAIINHPLTASLLLESIGQVLGKGTLVERRQIVDGREQRIARQKLAGARLLLVEDNEMNRELAMELLGMAGIDLICAQHGEEALDVLACDTRFDGVLMDCQMPVMDGYTATGLIRANPAWVHLPIIAMTANAMAGDKERVLAAGMNDHIAKPLNVEQMFATLARWITPRHPQGEQPVVVSSDEDEALPDISTLDLADGLARMQGNRRLYRQMLVRFWQGQHRFVETFTDALSKDDQVTALRLAHTLKGVASTIGATQVQQAAQMLEAACAGTDRSLIDECLRRLEPALSEVLSELMPLQAASPSTPDNQQPVQDISPQLERLAALLAESDAEALDICSELEGKITEPALREHFAAIRRHIDNFDFDEALKALQDGFSPQQQH